MAKTCGRDSVHMLLESEFTVKQDPEIADNISRLIVNWVDRQSTVGWRQSSQGRPGTEPDLCSVNLAATGETRTSAAGHCGRLLSAITTSISGLVPDGGWSEAGAMVVYERSAGKFAKSKLRHWRHYRTELPTTGRLSHQRHGTETWAVSAVSSPS